VRCCETRRLWLMYGTPDTACNCKAWRLAHADLPVCRAAEGLQLLPGIRELLAALQQRKDVVTGLVTGNLEPIGWAKMEALGVKELFSQPLVGGFGSDVCSGNLKEVWKDRGEMISVAERKMGGVPPDQIACRTFSCVAGRLLQTACAPPAMRSLVTHERPVNPLVMMNSHRTTAYTEVLVSALFTGCTSFFCQQCVAGDRKATYHVGDTPFDVKAAKQAGAVPIGVSTGIFSKEVLCEAEPDTVHVPSFADLEASMKVFGLT
jgi:phosphoglycolate phosphatase-like HAD superfamily hydrolase